MEFLPIILIVLLVLIVLGILLGKLTWDGGIRWLVIIAVLGLLLYVIFHYLG